MNLGAVFVPEYLYFNRPYLAHSFNDSIKYGCRFFHAKFFVSAMWEGRLKGFIKRGMWLFAREIDGNWHHIVLCISPDQKHEGELSLVFHWNRKVIYTLGFSFAPGSAVGLDDSETILIGRMQGHKGVFAEIREATKALSEVSPQNALLAAVEGLARSLGISTVVGVAGENCCSFKDGRPLEPFVKTYDEFFAAHGAEGPIDGFFRLPAPFPRKPLSEVKLGHRLRARKKQQMRAEIAGAAVQAMGEALDPGFATRREWIGGSRFRRLIDGLRPRAARDDEAVQARREKVALLDELALLERRARSAIAGASPLTQSLFNSKINLARRAAEIYAVGRLRALRFDEAFYIEQNHDVEGDGRRAALHYARLGRSLGRQARFGLIVRPAPDSASHATHQIDRAHLETGEGTTTPS
jgi:uncharacterized protein VirK/YbjX